MTDQLATTTKFLTSQQAELTQLVADVLQEAKSKGATAAAVSASRYTGFDLNVRLGDVENLEYNEDKGIGISVYFDQRKGSASTTDTRREALVDCVEKACQFARYTQDDPYNGLADKDLMASDYPDLDLCHPWDLDPERAITLAKECEAIALAQDKRIHNSEGVNIGTYHGVKAYGNSHGFMGTYPTSRHDISCILLAKDHKGMQRDYEYSTARNASDLYSIETIAKTAAKRTVERLGARRLKTCKVPVIFRADVARGFLSHFVGAIEGGNIYRQSSFLLDHLDKPVFAPHITLHEAPHLPGGIGSAPFDAEGVRTRAGDIVKDGILQHYILGSYSARKLGMQTTGNAGGVHNLFINNCDLNFSQLLKKMDTGLLVTEVMGHGINLVTGDYSRGAAGFWVEKGEIQYPVEEITIAGNLSDMYKNLQSVANDIDHRGNLKTGSILLEEMTVAGD